jgi:hypothetical protein
VLELNKVEYIPGVLVSGTQRNLGGLRARAVLRLSGPRTPDGTLRITNKRISGRLDGRRFSVRVPGSQASAATAGTTVTTRQLLRLAKHRRSLRIMR